mmetsp:Transcript_33975/g.55404  ORF Transcript_33975/g.55404 Transcript_33975/m.55404 type:complete len:238 (-) Transcript_33975:40-753(-)
MLKDNKKEILVLTAGLLLLGTQVKPLLNSSLISEELRTKINANVKVLTNQINVLLTSAASTLAETYASIKTGNSLSTQLLSRVSIILLMARVGIIRMCLILLTLSSIHVLGNNQTLIQFIENMEQYIFPQPFIAKIISQYPKTVEQCMEFAKIYWDVSEKLVSAVSSVFAAVMNPKQSGLSDILKTVENVTKTVQKMKLLENLDLPKLMQMIQMMNALDKSKAKTKGKIKTKTRPKL